MNFGNRAGAKSDYYLLKRAHKDGLIEHNSDGKITIMQGDYFMKKKIVSIIALLLCMVFILAGCGSKDTGSTASNNSGKDRVVIYTAAEDERIEYIQQELDKSSPMLKLSFSPLVQVSFCPSYKPKVKTAIVISSMILKWSMRRSF